MPRLRKKDSFSDVLFVFFFFLFSKTAVSLSVAAFRVSRDPLQKKIIRSLAPRKGERNARALDDTVSLRKTSERERTFYHKPLLCSPPPSAALFGDRARLPHTLSFQ
jgi:hypothetical protein